MAKKTTSKSQSKSKTPRRMSNLIKPTSMTTKEWQTRLRVQAAERETFTINGVGNGEYIVGNYATSHRYEVVWKGKDHPLNRCSCMDFRTSGLMTCKHLEAVKSDRSVNRYKPLSQEHCCLYVDYSEGPRLRLYCKGSDAQQIAELGKDIFNRWGFADVPGVPVSEIRHFINVAKKYSPRFTCTADAQEIVDMLYDNHVREERLNDIFSDRAWWKEYLVKDIVPYPYQAEGMEFAARAGKCLIADEMGLGKTIQAIGTASLLYKEGFVSSILIVCPTSLKYQWQKEIKKFCGEDAIVVEGLHTQRARMYKDPTPFKIVSYNALANDMKVLKEMSTDMIIMDEVQRLKNWNTQIAKGVRRINADYKVILSGTPLENKLEELYSIVQLADQYILGPYYEFRERHINADDTGKVVGYMNLNEVSQTLKPLMVRRRKVDVSLQLPERMDKNLFVPMTKEQREIHDEFGLSVARIVQKWKKMKFLSETDRRRLLLLLSQMRMVCNSTYILDQHSRHDTKIDEAISIINSVVESGNEKVVIFSQWERMTRLVAGELEKAGIGYEYLHGGIPSARRKELMDRFNENPEIRVFISTDAGSTGLNLQTASYIINMDLPWNPAVLEQRIGRIYRIGQQRNIQVINLVAMSTIEEQMLAKLRFKSSMFAGALDGGDDEVLLEGNKLQTIVEEFDFSPVQQEGTQAEEVSEVLHQDDAMDDLSDVDAAEIGPEFIEAEPYAVVSTKSSETGRTTDKVNASVDPAVDVVQKGMSFLTDLVGVLKDPDASRRMVDSIVTEDKQTGKTSLNIPVKDKDTVMQFVSLLGKLLG